jgi:flagellar biosynthesis/type III secretory pathway protein FliH
MDTQDIVETWRREAVQEGVHQGVEQGIKQGLVEVYEARFGAMPEALRAVVEAVDDQPTLVAWLRLVGTRSADEIALAIHSARAS